MEDHVVLVVNQNVRVYGKKVEVSAGRRRRGIQRHGLNTRSRVNKSAATGAAIQRSLKSYFDAVIEAETSVREGRKSTASRRWVPADRDLKHGAAGRSHKDSLILARPARGCSKERHLPRLINGWSA